jgi:uncharacterized protein YjgD (DUF1641 family)
MSPELGTETDALAAMLADPEIRQSLAVIVANAPTLAALASISTGLLQRGPEIADNINGLVRDLRSESGEGEGVSGVLPLVGALGNRADTITTLLDSAVLQPEVIEVIGRLGAAAQAADEQTAGKTVTVGGIFSILGKLKDPNVQETLAFLFAFADVFGQSQRTKKA